MNVTTTMNVHDSSLIQAITDTKLNLKIDKYSTTFSYDDRSKVNDLPDRLAEIKFEELFRGITIKSALRHRVQISIPLLVDGIYLADRAILDLIGRHPGISDGRLECNPDKIGPKGIAYLCKPLELITGIDPSEIFRNGKVTRIDLALHIHGKTPEDVIVRSKGQRKHGVYSDQSGKVQTIYCGTPKSNRTVAYDKSSPSSGKILRIERRLKPLCRGHELPALPDPFDKGQVIPTDALLPYLGDLMPRFLFDSLRLRGVRHTLSLLPAKQARQILNVIRDPAISALPSRSWSDWPELLRASGLPVF